VWATRCRLPGAFESALAFLTWVLGFLSLTATISTFLCRLKKRVSSEFCVHPELLRLRICNESQRLIFQCDFDRDKHARLIHGFCSIRLASRKILTMQPNGVKSLQWITRFCVFTGDSRMMPYVTLQSRCRIAGQIYGKEPCFVPARVTMTTFMEVSGAPCA
jgi:hypothetical protein